MSTVADTYKYVIGVDTHAKTHTYGYVNPSRTHQGNLSRTHFGRSGVSRAT
ncbi:hypothetical protein RCH22_002991 [Cryobacterium psychrotolerans]|nr:hypothetical protein [Cryobacterium psychrotolerans]